jgi:hypothetical protein
LDRREPVRPCRAAVNFAATWLWTICRLTDSIGAATLIAAIAVAPTGRLKSAERQQKPRRECWEFFSLGGTEGARHWHFKNDAWPTREPEIFGSLVPWSKRRLVSTSLMVILLAIIEYGNHLGSNASCCRGAVSRLYLHRRH